MAVVQWFRNRASHTALLLGAAALLISARNAEAGFIGRYAPGNWQWSDTVQCPDPNAQPADPACTGTASYLFGIGGSTLSMSGSWNGSGFPGMADLTVIVAAAGTVSFESLYDTLDYEFGSYDSAGYLLNGLFQSLGSSPNTSRSISVPVSAGDVFGFRMETVDNIGYPGELSIRNFNAPEPGGVVTPEPGSGMLIALALGGLAMWSCRKRPKIAVVALVAVAVSGVWAQQQHNYYSGVNVTGRLQLSRAVNMLQAAQQARLAPLGASAARLRTPEFKPPSRLLRPDSGPRQMGAQIQASSVPVSQLLNVTAAPPGTGFPGLTHYDQRMANRGNQYSVEPPNQSLAVGNGYLLAGVNNAVAVYNLSGAPLLPTVISSNELFGVAPAIDRFSGANGPFPTDMRVFFDQSISRWFVLQRAQDYDVFGNPINSSRIYLAVSQTNNPLGNFTIYTIDTTNLEINGCPCFSDYPQIGADQYGFYISVNEFSTLGSRFVTASILAISKASLATSAALPTVYKFTLPLVSGYEFTIHPATTPPGASYFMTLDGMQYFVSTNVNAMSDASLAVWALYNTKSLGTANPQLTLVQRSFPTIRFAYPDVATQKPGPIPYGSSVGAGLSFIDGGDTRIQSVTYSGARLYITVASQVIDDTSRRIVGAAYVVLTPVFRSGVLSASVMRQGYLAVRQNHLLRPAIAVNAQGKGAIAATLVGPAYYPSAAFIPVDVFPNTGTVYLAAAGAGPQDGFTGYEGSPARWGDYSTATVAGDGSIWMIMQYIPNAPRTEFANWGTYIRRYVP